jgi:hypothetical protein
MAISRYLGTFSSSNAAASQAITGVGFQPQLVEIFSALGLNAAATSSRKIYGATDGTNQFATESVIITAQNPSNTFRSFKNTKCVLSHTGGGAIYHEADITSLDADGFTLNWTTIGGAAQTYFFVAYAGLDNATVGTMDLTTSTGNQSVTGLGYQPDITRFTASGISTSAAILAGAAISHGAGISSTERFCIAAADEDNVNPVNAQSIYSDASCLQIFDVNAAIDCVADYVSSDAGGFTINKTNAPAATTRIGYITMQGVLASIGEYAVPVGTGNNSETGVGFQPEIDLFYCAGSSTKNAVVANNLTMFGASISAASVRSTFGSSIDNAASSNADRENRDAISLFYRSNFNGTLVSQDADGFTVNWADVTASGDLVPYVSLAASGDTITLTDPDNYRIYQRDTTTNDQSITFSGTYVGTPTAIAARVVEDGTSTEVVTWTTIDASPSGNAFSGALTVPEGGWYNVQVRYTNDTGITDNGTNQWGIGILVGCIGQSNIARWFTDGSGNTPNDLLKEYAAGAWKLPSVFANGAVTFGNRIITNLTSPVPVGLINYAIGGSALRLEAEGANDYWENTAAASIYDDFKVAVTALGGELEFIIWGQGETEARSDVVTEAEYQSSLSSFITSQIRTDITNASDQTNLPFIISLLGRGTAVGDDDDDFQFVRNAQEYHANNTADCYRFTAVDLPITGDIHYTPAGYITHGNRGSQVVLKILGEETYHRGPRTTSWVADSSTQTTVTLVHDGGTTFTPTTAITGFEVLDDGTPVTISAAIRADATHVQLTHTAISGTETVRYLYGADPVVTSPVVDDTALTLPLEGEDSITEFIAAVGGLGGIGPVRRTKIRRASR